MNKIFSSLLVGMSVASLCNGLSYSLQVHAEDQVTTSSTTQSDETKIEPIVGVWLNKDKNFVIITPSHFIHSKSDQSIKDLTTENELTYKLSLGNKEEVKLQLSETKDTLTFNDQEYSRKLDNNLINYTKDQLSDLEPINLEQLLTIDDNFLMAYGQQYLVDAKETEPAIHEIYLALAKEYPELKLLTEKDYDAYLELVDDMKSEYSYSLAIINTADPYKVLNHYRNLQKQSLAQEEILGQMFEMIGQEHQAYLERKEQSGKTYLEPYQWPTSDEKANPSDKKNSNQSNKDPHLLAENEYKVRDGEFSQEEAYTILVKATGYDVDYSTGSFNQEVGAYQFVIDNLTYFVHADGEIVTSDGGVFNRNEDSRLARTAISNSPEQNGTANVPDYFDVEPENAVISPFYPDLAFNHLKRSGESFPADAFLSFFEYNTDGSYTLFISSKDKMTDKGMTAEEALIVTYIVYPNGHYLIK